MKYLICNKDNREDHYFMNGSDSEEIYHKIINTLDCSNEWVYYRVVYLLKMYKKICDKLDHDCEFIYEDDIINNDGAFLEILSLMDKYPNVKVVV